MSEQRRNKVNNKVNFFSAKFLKVICVLWYGERETIHGTYYIVLLHK